MECCRDVSILHYSQVSSTYPMTISLVQWRALIGIFNCRIPGTSTNNRYNLIRNYVSVVENLLLFYHYLEEVYIPIIIFLYILFFYCAMGMLKQTQV